LQKTLDEKIEKAVSLIKNAGIDRYEVFSLSADIIRAESENRLMKGLERSSESGLGIRILKNGSMGFAYGSHADKNLIDSAIVSASHQFADDFNVIPERCGEYKPADIFDLNISALTAEECIERAIVLETAAREYDRRILQIRKASFARAISKVRIVNSSGIDVSGSATYCTASIMVMAGSGEDMQSGYDYGVTHRLENLDIGKVGRTASQNAVSMLGARHINTSRMPVMFDNTTTAEIIESISGSFVGENVLKGKSLLKDRLGDLFFSKCITLADNPLDPDSIDSFPFDGEGIASRKNILIEGGRVASFVYDSYWGKRAGGMPSTGNSVRGSYRSAPVLGIRHLYLEPGSDMAGVLNGLGRTIKVTDIMGMHTVDPISGEFSVGINGIMLENGVPAYPVREAAIAGNLFSILGNVVHVGDDMRSFGNVQTPSILIEEMDVSSK
jgi:PmbA protein